MHLYELTDEYKVLERLVEQDNIDEDSARNELNSLVSEFDNKAENIGKFILSLNADTEAIKAEEARLAARRKAVENKIDWLKGYLLQEMLAVGMERVKGSVVTVSVRNNPPSVGVIKEDDIPKEFRRVVPETWTPDKKLILEHFKATGEIVPGVDIIRDKKSLNIR